MCEYNDFNTKLNFLVLMNDDDEGIFCNSKNSIISKSKKPSQNNCKVKVIYRQDYKEYK